MTIEQKAKAYDEAVNKLRRFMEQGIDPLITRADVQDFFPELKESEDERIRKHIISVLEDCWQTCKNIDYDSSRIQEDIAWFEKQGEQKVTIEIKTPEESLNIDSKTYNEIVNDCIFGENKPKFKVGDWILYSGDNYEGVRHITKINENGYYIERNGLPHGIIPFNHEICMRLWTIQDAKDGDVLYHSDTASNGIFIFKELLKYEFCEEVRCYCDYDSEDHFCLGEHHTCCWADAKILHPATKEQRNLLFSKMKEAGYEWDAEKKELKKIDNEEVNGEDYGIDGLWHAQRILENTLGNVYGYQTDDGILDHKAAITAVKKLYKQKHT